MNRFWRTYDPNDLEHAMVHAGKGVDTAQVPLQKAASLNNLSTALRERFLLFGLGAELNEAIESAEASIAATVAPQHRSNHLSTLALALRERYLWEGAVADLSRAISLLEEASSNALDDLAKGRCLSNLAICLRDRFERGGVIADLDDSIRALERAAKHLSAFPLEYAGCLNNLSNHSRERYLHTGAAQDREATDHYIQELNGLLSRSTNAPAEQRATLANSFRDICSEAGYHDNLDAAVEHSRKAINGIPETSPKLPRLLQSLSEALQERWRTRSNVEDLDEAIAQARQAVAQVPAGAPERPRFLTSLGNALRLHSRQSGSLESLSRAVGILHEALVATPERSSEGPARLSNYASALLTLHDHTNAPQLLIESIRLLEASVADTSRSSPRLSVRLANLAKARLELAQDKKDVPLLTQTVSTYRVAIDSARVHRPWDVPGLQDGLAGTLLSIYELTLDSTPLNQAINLLEQVTGDSSSSSSELARSLHKLGNAYLRRQKLVTDVAERQRFTEDIRRTFQTAIKVGRVSGPEQALAAAAAWSTWALEREAWSEAESALKCGIGLLDEVLQLQSLRVFEEIWLMRMGGLHAALGYAQARQQRRNDAWQTLEAGRIRVFREKLLGREWRHSRLREEAPELAEELERHLARLDSLTARERELLRSATSSEETFYALSAELARGRQRVSELLGSAKEKISGGPPVGTDNSDLSARVPESVPVLYLAPTPIGTVLLLVTRRSDRILTRCEFADALTDTVVSALASRWWKAYSDWTRAGEEPGREEHWRDVLQTTRTELANLLMDQAHAMIRASQSESDSATRVLLIPCGPLTHFPLHSIAAETGNPQATPAFSYLPSLETLTDSPYNPNTDLPSWTWSGYAPFEAGPGAPPSATHELANGTALFRTSHCFGATTVDDVRRQFEVSNIVHIATHAEAHPQHPLDSRICLRRDGQGAAADLTVAHILEGSWPAVDLVVLSACETGIVGVHLPDEVIAFPSAFLATGCRSVISTLWKVEDVSTALLLERFYDNWIQRGATPDVALRDAQAWLRVARGCELFERLEGWAQKKPLSEELLLRIRKFRKDPDIAPFSHPYYWAGFIFSGWWGPA